MNHTTARFSALNLCVLLIAFCGVALCGASVSLAKDQLDGKWDVTVTPDDDAHAAGARELHDTFTFKDSTFDDKEMAKHGFEKGAYDEDTRGMDVGGFKAERESKKDEGKAKWSGTATSDQLTGDLVWTKKDGTVWNYTFKGTKQ